MGGFGDGGLWSNVNYFEYPDVGNYDSDYPEDYKNKEIEEEEDGEALENN